MEKFTINKKTYVVNKELGFDFLVLLDKNDVKVTNVAGLAAVNCFFAYISGMDEQAASNEITAHVMNGGKLDDVINAYAKALDESGFFRTIIQQAETGQKEMEQEPPKTTKGKKNTTVTE